MKGLILISLGLLVSCNRSGDNIVTGDVTISKIVKYTSVTLQNKASQSVDIQNWKLEEIVHAILGGNADTNTCVITGGTIGPNACLTFTAETIHFTLGADETVYLYNPEGTEVAQMSWLFFEHS